MTGWKELLQELERVVVDTNVLIYFVDKTEPYARLVELLFRHCEGGALSVVIPTLVELELLVGPLRDEDREAVDRLQLLLDHFPNLEVAPMNRPIARRAAEVRARHDLATPDAIVVGTALVEDADSIITNDKAWASRIDRPRCVLVADYI